MLSGTSKQKLTTSCTNVEDNYLIVGAGRNEQSESFYKGLQDKFILFLLFCLLLDSFDYLYITRK